MRIVNAPEELPSLFLQAQQEAGSAFSSPDVYLEKYIGAPRHIEFQMLADEHGNVEILGERECSIQRRHQKLLEESPSPAVTDAQRAEISAVLRNAIADVGLHQRRHGGVPDGRERQALLHRGERARAGGAPGDRVRDRHRHREEPDPDRAGRDPGRDPARPGGTARPRHRVPHQRRESRDVRALARAASPASTCRAASACAWTRGPTPIASFRRTTIRWSPS